MNELDVLYGCFNQYVFKLAKDNWQALYDYYNRLPGGRTYHKLAFDLLDVIRTKEFTEIEAPTFMDILAREGKNEAESREIMSNLFRWKSYTKEQIAPTKEFLKSMIANGILGKATELFGGSPVDFITYIKNSDVKVKDDDYKAVTNFNNLDIPSIIAEDFSEQFISSLDFLNLCYEPHHTVPGSQIIVVSGLPGSGKSLALASEVLQYATCNGGRGGEHVLYLIMGDLREKDIIIRMDVLLNGISFAESGSDIMAAYNRVLAAVGDRLHLWFAPAGKVSATDVVNYAKEHPEIKVYALDYDSLFAPEPGGSTRSDSLYLSLGDTYNTLTELSTGMGKLVYVASQPKSFGMTDNTEAFSGSSLADSRRKLEIADCIITFGIAQDVSVPCGIIKVDKNRRGKKAKFYYCRPEARIRIIPEGVYNFIKENYRDSSQTMTDADLARIVERFRVEQAVISAQMAAAMPPQMPQPGQIMQSPVAVSEPTSKRGKKKKSPFPEK